MQQLSDYPSFSLYMLCTQVSYPKASIVATYCTHRNEVYIKYIHFHEGFPVLESGLLLISFTCRTVSRNNPSEVQGVILHSYKHEEGVPLQFSPSFLTLHLSFIMNRDKPLCWGKSGIGRGWPKGSRSSQNTITGD